jgi:predicted cobalt transporter CbtA
MMSPERPEAPRADRDGRRLFALALAVFAAWAIGLGIMAFNSAERPRPVEAEPSRSS